MLEMQEDYMVALAESLEGDMGCEHSLHDYQPKYHSGNGEWYFWLLCPDCEHSMVILVCDKYKKTVYDRNILTYCADCPGSSFAQDYYVKVLRKD
jgi:hypothetical protein